MFGKKSRIDTAPAPRSGTGPTPLVTTRPPGSSGKQAYEARRAAKAGMGVDKWLAEKGRRAEADREATEKARQDALAAARPATPGLLRRLLDRAHRPL